MLIFLITAYPIHILHKLLNSVSYNVHKVNYKLCKCLHSAVHWPANYSLCTICTYSFVPNVASVGKNLCWEQTFIT